LSNIEADLLFGPDQIESRAAVFDSVIAFSEA
jgi:hypothetical protein